MSAPLASRLLNFAKFSVRSYRCSSIRQFNHGRVLCNATEKFQAAQEMVGKLKEDPGNEVKLKIYALFKQSTVGECSTPKPGIMDFVGRAKWEAWKNLGSLSKDDAMSKYIELVEKLSEDESPPPHQADDSQYQEILVTRDKHICRITLNRPSKKNAINFKMYEEWSDVLEQAAQDDSVTIATITGAGDYYCSGNDLANFTNVPPEGIAEMAKQGGEILRRFVMAFIDFPKPLIGIINGPAIGVSVSTLGLLDLVYASDRATFHTPFTALGQSPEGCSSLVFPKIMGHAKATEMLLFNRKLTAHQAAERSLVTEVFPEQTFQQEVEARIAEISELPKDSLKLSKTLMRDVDRDALHRANDRECTLLVDRWQSPECANAVMKFFTKND